MKELAGMFKALSDETRLEILFLLFEYGELCVCDVEGILEITQSKSSRHLRYLLNSGLVENRRNAVWMYYSLPRQSTEEVESILGTLKNLPATPRASELRVQAAEWFAQKPGGEPCGSDACS